MGKNKIGEALLKINSGQPGSPIGPEQPKKPIQVPGIDEYWNVSNNTEKKYTPGADIYAPENESMRGGDATYMVKSIFNPGVGEVVNNSLPDIESYFNYNADPSKDPDWAKKGIAGTANDFGNFFKEMENAGADDQNALFYARKIMGDKNMRKKIFNDQSPIRNLGKLRYLLTPTNGSYLGVDLDKVEDLPLSGTRLEGLTNRLASVYMGLHKNRAKDYNIPRGTKITSQESEPVQGGMQGLEQAVEQAVNKNKDVKLKVKKTP